MKQLALNKKCSPNILTEYGFKKYGMNYKKFIPLYQKKNETLIELEILISLEGNYIGYDVIDTCNDTLYTAFYDQEYAPESIVLNKVKKKINDTFADLIVSNIIKEGVTIFA